MSNKLYEENSIKAIAEAIRAKSNSAKAYKVSEMANAITLIETGTEASDIEWHQCPEQPRKFVAEVTYDPSDYSTSKIEDYAPDYPVVSNFKPIGYTVDNTTFYNEIPNVLTKFQTETQYGTLKPLDKVRYINTPSAPNVRDIGGWECDGGNVKYGMLFRGGYLSISDRDVLVNQLGIRHDLDLRGASEAQITESPLGSDIYYTCAKNYNWYSVSNNDAWKTNIRCAFDAVAHNEPVYFHCAAGADRTGTLACVLEGLLGMSQSDIDKDYELTSFYSGTTADSASRRRNESDWIGLISGINAYSGNTFRDKCVSFVETLGFTIDEINAYRKNMIDGTPDEVTSSTENYTVTNNLVNVKTDNSKAATMQYQPYTATITCSSGHVINNVEILMDGVDITKSVWTGTETNIYKSVAFNLKNCTLDNLPNSVIYGQSYATTVIVDSGSYTLEGAEVKIMMGGEDVTDRYYKNGIIAIPSVTGNLVININAIEIADNTNLIDLYGISDAGYRISTSSGANSAGFSDSYAIGATNDAAGIIPASDSDTFYIYGAKWFLNSYYYILAMKYLASGSYSKAIYLQPNEIGCSYDSLNNILSFKVGDAYSMSDGEGVRFSLVAKDGSNLIVTKNALPNIEYATKCPISYELLNCTISNSNKEVNVGDAYNCTIKASSSFEILRVSMGYTDVTSNCVSVSGTTATISITSVTEPVVIVAVSGGTEVVSTSIGSDGNIFNTTGYIEGKRISTSTGALVDSTEFNEIVTGFIPISDGDVFYFQDAYLLDWVTSTQSATIYDQNFSLMDTILTESFLGHDTYSHAKLEVTEQVVIKNYRGMAKMKFIGYGGAYKYIRFAIGRESADKVPKIYKA